MKTMHRRTNWIILALKWAGVMVLSLLAVLFIIRWIGRGINKRIPEGGVNTSMYVDVNGSRQWINIYGQDRNNPVLLYLHGGPGSATSLLIMLSPGSGAMYIPSSPGTSVDVERALTCLIRKPSLQKS